VRTVDDTTSLEQAVVENLHRQDLNALEEAAAYQQLIEDFGLSHDDVARRVGKSRSAVSNTLRLFQLPPTIQKLVAEGQLAAGHARALLGTPDRAFQEALARRAVADQLSVRDVEEAVRARGGELAPEPPGAGASPGSGGAATGGSSSSRLRPPGLLELEQLLSDRLDTRVKVVMGAKRGKVTIEFATLEDLERIYRAMTAPPPSLD
jgi:ParB family chromosome partitioning protein